jgi:YVTN family beta-propeller protein
LLKGLGQSRYRDVVAAHVKVLRQALEEHGGQEIDTQGDSFFAVFRSAASAVASAEAAQRALAEGDWSEGIDLRVRMGLHTGEPLAASERYVGLGVHRAARICAAAHGGQILVSKTTHDLLEDEELEAIDFKDLGEHRLKDFDRAERLFQVMVAGLPTEFPSPRTGIAQRPAETPFAGREDELAEATRAALGGRRLRRRAILVPMLASVLAAAVAIPIFALGRGDPGTRALTAAGTAAVNSVAFIDAQTNEVAERIPVGAHPMAVVAGEDAVWVANLDDNTISRIDAASHTVADTIGVGVPPTRVAVGEGSLWVTSGYEGKLIRVNASTGKVVASKQLREPTETRTRVASTSPISGGSAWMAVAAGHGSVWVADRNQLALLRLDANTLEKVATIADVDVDSMVVTNDAVWAVDYAGRGVLEIDPATDRVLKRVSVDLNTAPKGIAVSETAAWVSDNRQDFMLKVARTGSAVERTINVGDGPTDVAFAHGSVWVANWNDGTVSRLDPQSNEVVETIQVGGKLGGLAADENGIWVTVFAR